MVMEAALGVVEIAQSAVEEREKRNKKVPHVENKLTNKRRKACMEKKHARCAAPCVATSHSALSTLENCYASSRGAREELCGTLLKNCAQCGERKLEKKPFITIIPSTTEISVFSSSIL